MKIEFKTIYIDEQSDAPLDLAIAHFATVHLALLAALLHLLANLPTHTDTHY